MIYFSEIKGSPIYSSDQHVIGKLEDLSFLINGMPTITNLIVKSKKGKKITIPSKYLLKDNITFLEKPIIVDKNYQEGQISKNELQILSNLLDKQIIDLVGNKVVRVNDIAIQDKEELYIAGVDVGVLGILRWLKLEDNIIKLYSFFKIKIVPKLLSWGDVQPLHLTRGKLMLKKKEAVLKNVRPEDLAEHLEKTHVDNTRRLIRFLDEERAADVISNLNPNYQSRLFLSLIPDEAARWINYIDLDDAVDILLLLPAKKREQICSLLTPDKKDQLNNLLNLSKISDIGKFINTQYISVSPFLTVKEVIAMIKKETRLFPILNYAYVINEKKQLVGVFSLHELLLQNMDIQVVKFMMQNLIVLHLHTPKDVALRRMLKYKLSALPVVEKNKRLIGMVLLDDLTDEILEHV